MCCYGIINDNNFLKTNTLRIAGTDYVFKIRCPINILKAMNVQFK